MHEPAKVALPYLNLVSTISFDFNQVYNYNRIILYTN